MSYRFELIVRCFNNTKINLKTGEVKKEYKKDELNYQVKVPLNSDIVIPGMGFMNIKDKGVIETNLENLEVRKDISGEEF